MDLEDAISELETFVLSLVFMNKCLSTVLSKIAGPQFFLSSSIKS